MYTRAQFPSQVWDGDTENPWRQSRSNDLAPNAKDWDQVVAEVIATQEHLTCGEPTSLFFVDKNRTANYTPDGTILRPYRDIPSALNATTATELNRQTIMLFPGRYTLGSTLILKPHVDISGFTADPTYLEFAGEVVRAPTSMNLGGAALSNLLISCLSSVITDWAVRIQHRGSVLFRNVSISSIAQGVVLEGDSFASGQFFGVNSIYDALKLQGTSFMALEHAIVGCVDVGSDDVIVEAGAFIQWDASTWFYNNSFSIAGTVFRTTYDERINNTSSVAGDTVKDALNTLGHVPDPASLANGFYRLQVTGGVATWVVDAA